MHWFAGVTSNTIQPTPQNIPLVDPSLYSAQSAGGLVAFVLLYMDVLCPLCLPCTKGRSLRNIVVVTWMLFQHFKKNGQHLSNCVAKSLVVSESCYSIVLSFWLLWTSELSLCKACYYLYCCFSGEVLIYFAKPIFLIASLNYIFCN